MQMSRPLKWLSHLLGVLWYLIFYLLLIPWLVLYLGRSLDYLFLRHLLGLEGITLWQLLGLNPLVFHVLGGLIAASGALVFIKAWGDLAGRGKFFPLSVVSHEHLGPDKLVTTGLYAHVRHPMLLGYLILLIGVGTYFGSGFSVFWMVPMVAALGLEFTVRGEERTLKSWFGRDYEVYQKKVPPLVPRFKPVNSLDEE